MFGFILFLAYIIAIFLVQSYAFLSIALFINILIMLIYKINFKKVMNNLLGISIFVFVTFIINLIVMNTTEALMISARLILVCNITYIFSKIMTPLKMVESIEKILKPANTFIGSSEDIGVLICIAISFVPIFKDEMKAVLMAMKAKGIKIGVKNFHLILTPILVSSLKKVNDIEMSLKAKGYR